MNGHRTRRWGANDAGFFVALEMNDSVGRGEPTLGVRDGAVAEPHQCLVRRLEFIRDLDDVTQVAALPETGRREAAAICDYGVIGEWATRFGPETCLTSP